jgi:acyl carrier protein
MELMSNPTLLAEVAQAVRTAAKVPPHVVITDNSRLIDDLNIDSLDLVGVLLQIQDHFDIVIEDEVVPSLRRIADLADYVASRRGAAAA